MNNLIVMYHYIRDDKNFKAMSVNNFRRQIKVIKEKYEILTLSEVLDYKGSKPTCVLTFDDGLKDVVTNVLPVLINNQIRATFFIPGKILNSTSILNVQKRHMLLATIGSKKLIKELNSLLPQELKIVSDPIFKADYLDSLSVCSMKWILDFVDPEIIDPILSEVFYKYYPDEVSIFKSFYLSRDDIDVLLSYNMEIGVHGYSHRQLGASEYISQYKDIESGTKIIKSIIGNRPLVFSYPSGSYNPLTVRLLKKFGYFAAVTTNKHMNISKTNKYELGRFDCVDI